MNHQTTVYHLLLFQFWNTIKQFERFHIKHMKIYFPVQFLKT